MNKLEKMAVAVMVLFFSITLLSPTIVNAKKLTVNFVEGLNNTTEIAGKLTLKKVKNLKGYKVRVRIAKKNGKYRKKKYTATVKKKGKFTVKNLPTLKNGWKVKVKVYNKKKKLVKKKVIKIKVPTYISKTTYTQILNDMETDKKTLANATKAGGDVVEWGGKLMIERPYSYVKGGYLIHPDGTCFIGEWEKYLDFDYSGCPEKVTFIALNGATIYGCVSDGTTSGRSNDLELIREPTTTDYDFKITSGQKKTYYGDDFEKLSTYGLFYKVIIYKNGKLVAMQYNSLALLAQYSKWYPNG